MMKNAFLLRSYPEAEETLHELQWNVPDILNKSPISFLTQRRNLEDFPKDFAQHVEFRWVKKGAEGRWPDFYSGAGGWILVSLRFQELLLRESGSPEHYLFLEPVYTNDSADSRHMGYRLLNLCDHLTCVDWEHSRYTERDGGKFVHEFVLRHNAVDGLMHMFRIKEDPSAIGLSRQLGGVLLNHGLTGFSMEPVHLSLAHDAPGYPAWLAEMEIQKDEWARRVSERRKRLGLVPKSDGTEYKPGDPYPIVVPETGPFKDFPDTIPFPAPHKP